MRYVILIACREFIENAKTKGFWISICLLPAILFLAIQIPVWLEKKGTPVRHFILVDQSGIFEQVVTDTLERRHQQNVLQALHEYARKFARTDSVSAATEPSAERSWQDLLRELQPGDDQGLERFIQRGGKEFFLQSIKPHLRQNSPPFEEPRRSFQRIGLPEEIEQGISHNELIDRLKSYLRGHKKIDVAGQATDLYAVVLVPPDIENQIVRPGGNPPTQDGDRRGIEYWADNVADMGLREELRQIVNAEIRRREYIARGLDIGMVKEVESVHVPFASLDPKKSEGEEGVSRADVLRQWAPAGFVYLLWVSIFTVAQMLLNNTIEEKSNRIVEVLLSSVTPGELMIGKLAGIAAVGLTMVAVWLAAGIGILAWNITGQSDIPRELLNVVGNIRLIAAFVVYFILGYVMYAGVILSIGSLCSTIKESQNYMGVIVMIMIVPLLTMGFIPKDPNGALATTLSWIPFYTPFVMMNRAAADPPLFDVVGTMILLVLFTAAVLWLSGKIFRTGILRTGQPPRLFELVRWLKG